MSTSSPPNADTSGSVRPVVQLDDLDTDELRLVASFVARVRSWRERQPSSGDEFQALWHRVKAKSSEILDDDVVMSVALEAEASKRRDLDPVTLSLLNAPVDDEPLTEADLADIAASEEDIRCGRVYTTEQVCEMLGIELDHGNPVEMASPDVTTTR